MALRTCLLATVANHLVRSSGYCPAFYVSQQHILKLFESYCCGVVFAALFDTHSNYLALNYVVLNVPYCAP
ncbi:hypothetical protein B0H21DRAFT_734490 [Amylocystis lapponica]|nr:hypothetical protein B0H21DRAFT_734490 [Amylocystis lapponica]